MSRERLDERITSELSRLEANLAAIENGAETLSRSEERLRLTLDAGRMGVWELDQATRIGHMDGISAALLEFSADKREVSVAEFLARVHPEERPEIERRVAHAKITGDDYAGEYRVILPDGDIRWIASLGRFVFSEGNPLRRVSVKYDIAERKRAELVMRAW
jgi:PAS domain-containing protein